MSVIARLRRRRELKRNMRKANPRGLTAKCYAEELRRQKAAAREQEIAKLFPPPDPDLAYARHLAPHLIPSAPMTRDQKAAAMSRAAVEESLRRR